MPKLYVKVLKARDLKAADKTGKSDPFVTVKRGSENCKTSVIDKTLNPIWNEVFIFEGASGTLLFTGMFKM
jgi:Ca2+-dependent lipid-binding protein